MIRRNKNANSYKMKDSDMQNVKFLSMLLVFEERAALHLELQEETKLKAKCLE